MNTLIRSTIFLALSIGAFGDVSHYFFPELNLFQPPQQQPHPPFLYTPSLPTIQPSPSPSSTTEFFLPEIISNRRVKEPKHGNFIPINHYLPPAMDDGHHLIQQDQIPLMSYLPPKPDKPIVVMDDPSELKGYEYKDPSVSITQNDEEPFSQFPSGLLPPFPDMSINVDETQTTTTNPNQGYNYDAPGKSHQDSSNGHLRLHIKEMRCLENQNGFFRAILRVDSFLGTAPIIEHDSNDPKCAVKLNRNFLLVNVEAEDFQKCGVRYCGKELCLRLRFLSISGIRTSSDSLLSLRCKTQTRVAEKTHSLKMGISNDIQARNTDLYAAGGAQNEFRTHVELLRKSSKGFSRKIEPKDVVRLGEELLLRAHVGPGDGWNFTKLTDVNLQQISAAGELTRSVNLITSNGCVNPLLRSICPQSPIFEPPLGHRLLFRAVMFQEMRSGEAMVLSMKITGCLEQTDCQNSQEECSEGNFKRQRRHLSNNSTNFSEFPKISFRVEMPLEEGDSKMDSKEPLVNVLVQHWIIIGTLMFIGALSFLAVLIYCISKR